MNRDSGKLKHGELLEESFDFKSITWKIPDFLSLPDYVDYKVQSATFSFASATWRLVMYPNGEKISDTEGYISLAIVRLNSQIPEHYISFELCFKTHNGKEFDSYCSRQLYTTDYNEFGAFKFMKKSKFQQMLRTIVPNGILSVICKMRTKKIAGIDKYSQVETTSLLGSDDMLKPKLLDVYENKLICDFKEFFSKKHGCDVLLKVNGVEFPAHRAILSARSSVFASAFRSDTKEKASIVIEIEDCDSSTFSDFLCFLYCGNIQNLSSENAPGLFTSADKYDVPDLRAKCIEFMKENLSVDTFCDTLSLALNHFENELIEQATEFFTENLKEIVATAKWESFVLKNPIQSNKLLIKALLPD